MKITNISKYARYIPSVDQHVKPGESADVMPEVGNHLLAVEKDHWRAGTPVSAPEAKPEAAPEK